MDHIAAVTAAFSAGKLPTTAQMNAAADWLLQSSLIQVEQTTAQTGGKLSDHGVVVLRDIRNIVEAYKQVNADKNGDDQIQDAIWNLSQAELRHGDQSEAATDANKAAGALKELLNLLLTHVSLESGDVLAEFLSFSRSSLADVAEAVQNQAGQAKDSLRQTEDEVQQGDRDALGRKNDELEQQGKDADAKEKWERGMDSVKVTGSKVIGTGQDAKATAAGLGKRASDRFDEGLWNICERAQQDEEYHSCIDTLFDLAHKWVEGAIDRSAETANSNKSPSEAFGDFVEDPSGRINSALRSLRVVAERFAGGKSLDDLFRATTVCMADIKHDPDLHKWWEGYEAYVRKCLDEPGYARSEDCKKTRDDLSERWDRITDADSDDARKWKKDSEAWKQQWAEFGDAVAKDGSLQRLKDAHKALAGDLANAGPTAAEAAIGQANWMWSDLVDVLLPRVFDFIKDIPLPRTEYKDDDVEMVFDELDISSLSILPGHVHISHTTEVDVDRPNNDSVRKDISTRTKISATGIQLALHDVSFYYEDKSIKGIKNVTGLLNVTLPPKGIDVEITLGLLPTTSGTKERKERQGFHNIESVNVSLNDVAVAIKKSNHQVLLSVFKPIFKSRLVQALKSSLEEYIRVGLEYLDHTAYDTHRRAVVFSDAGAPTPAAYISGFISRMGYMLKQTSVLEGVQLTSVGVVKDVPDSDKAFAVGSAPQIISGDKHGPAAKNTAPGTGIDSMDGGVGKSTGPGAGDMASAAVSTGKSYKATIQQKKEEEVAKDGWKSDAFNV